MLKRRGREGGREGGEEGEEVVDLLEGGEVVMRLDLLHAEEGRKGGREGGRE